MLKAIIFSLNPQIKHYWLNTCVRILFYCESTLHLHCFYYCGITSCNIYVNFFNLFVCFVLAIEINTSLHCRKKQTGAGETDMLITWISFSQASAAAVSSVWCLFSLTNYCIVILFFTDIHAPLLPKHWHQAGFLCFSSALEISAIPNKDLSKLVLKTDTFSLSVILRRVMVLSSPV